MPAGEITRCEPARLLAVTWEFGGSVSWVTVRLADDPTGGARLELEHIAQVGDELWDRFGAGAVGVGWDLLLPPPAGRVRTYAEPFRRSGCKGPGDHSRVRIKIIANSEAIAVRFQNICIA
jgi:hypothetical protein